MRGGVAEAGYGEEEIAERAAAGASASAEAYSQCRASSGLSFAARRAGKIAATMPTITAATPKTTSCVIGSVNSMKSTRAISRPASTILSAIPIAAPIRGDHALVADHAAYLPPCHPIARSIPISRVRSNTVRISVLMIPKKLTSTESASST